MTRDDYQRIAVRIRLMGGEAGPDRDVILSALDRAMSCCRSTPDPGSWTAGVNDAADPRMVNLMHSVADNLSYQTPLPDFIRMLKAAVGFDSRTYLGGDLQRCLLSNAAARLQLLSEKIDPHPWSTLRWRLRDAWDVIRRRAVAIRVVGSVYDTNQKA